MSDTSPAAPLSRWLDNPYVLLVLTTAMWAGNSVAGRLIAGEASPMVVTSLRWLLTVAALATFALPGLKADWPALRPWIPRLILLGGLGYTGFNALFYAAAYTTTAINISILQGTIPLLVFVIAVAFGTQAVRMAQVTGLVLGLLGVMAVASNLDPQRLVTLQFARGDLYMLAACLFYSFYTFMIRRRPAVAAISFFAVMAVTAALTSLPLLAIEHWRGEVIWPTGKGWVIMAYIVIFPSFLSQLCFLRAVQKIGPARAGLFTNLVPVLGAMMGTAIGETLGLAQIIGLVFVVGGILWSETRR